MHRAAGARAAEQRQHSSARDLQAGVQLHFEILTPHLHYICSVVLLFYLIFEQSFHRSQNRNNFLFPSHQPTASYINFLWTILSSCHIAPFHYNNLDEIFTLLGA